MKGYYFITDSGLSRAGIFSDVKNALRAGVKIIQYREKNKTTRQMYEEAIRLRKICRNITFLINDRVDIALAAGADGVHLGSRDLSYKIARKLLGSKKIIGLSTHSLKEARQAERQGADYIGVGPIFATKTKPDAGRPKGIELIKQIKKRVGIPVVAIGGINLENAAEVIRAGADGLCAISAVIRSRNLAARIRQFESLYKTYQKNT